MRKHQDIAFFLNFLSLIIHILLLLLVGIIGNPAVLVGFTMCAFPSFSMIMLLKRTRAGLPGGKWQKVSFISLIFYFFGILVLLITGSMPTLFVLVMLLQIYNLIVLTKLKKHADK